MMGRDREVGLETSGMGWEEMGSLAVMTRPTAKHLHFLELEEST
jgi:hypothetical protein